MSEAPIKRGKGRGKGDADTPNNQPQPVGAPIQQVQRPGKNDDDEDQEPDGQMSLPLPVCGGWFCPNENPDETCFRRFSNELTVPCNPCIMRFPTLFETNKFCFITGRFAFQVATVIRKLVFLIALFLSLTGMGLFAYSIVGAFASEDMIRNNAWITVTRKIKTGTQGRMTPKIIGSFSAMYLQNPQQAVEMLSKSGFGDANKSCIEYDLAKFAKLLTLGDKEKQNIDNIMEKDGKKCECTLKEWVPEKPKETYGTICTENVLSTKSGDFTMKWFASPFGRITEFSEFSGMGTYNHIESTIKAEYGSPNRFIGWNSEDEATAGNFFGKDHRKNNNQLVYVHWQGDTCLAGPHFLSPFCAHETLPMIFILCILGFLAQISASMADCQRWTEYGDINCQKFNGWCSAILVCASAFSAWVVWGSFEEDLKKLASFPVGGASYMEFSNDPDMEVKSCILKWFLLIIGCCKIYDILAHCLVATPRGRHAKWDEGNEPGEMIDYLLRFRDPNEAELPYSATH